MTFNLHRRVHLNDPFVATIKFTTVATFIINAFIIVAIIGGSIIIVRHANSLKQCHGGKENLTNCLTKVFIA